MHTACNTNLLLKGDERWPEKVLTLGLRRAEKFPEVYVIPPQHFQFPIYKTEILIPF